MLYMHFPPNLTRVTTLGLPQYRRQNFRMGGVKIEAPSGWVWGGGVWRRLIDNTWPIAALTSCSEAIYWPRIDRLVFNSTFSTKRLYRTMRKVKVC